MNKCESCGEKGFNTSYMPTTKSRMLEKGVCFTCLFWLDVIQDKSIIVIGGSAYSIGDGTGDGMAGRKFDIERLAGDSFTTNDLWYRGAIPEIFKDRLPDNARFLNGASKQQCGDTYCFNPSSQFGIDITES